MTFLYLNRKDMKAVFNHLTLNVSNFEKSSAFYKNLFQYLEAEFIKDEPNHLGVRLGEGEIWIRETESEYKKQGFHRKATGLNHLAFRVEKKEEVDLFYTEFLKIRNIPSLYGSPAHYPYTEKYYAVYFEDPDRIKLEIVYL